MSRSDIIHTVHELATYEESTDDSSHTPDEKYYYQVNKRKRKTNIPQKRDSNGNEYADNESENGEKFEPVNLINKVDRVANNVAACYDGQKNPATCASSSLLDQQRIYNLLLDYLLLKYQIPPETRLQSPVTCGSLFCAEKIITKSKDGSFRELESDANKKPFQTLLDPGNAQIPGMLLSVNQPHRENLQNSNRDSELGMSNLLNNTAHNFKNSIYEAISTCIHNIPIPKTGHTNYEAMLLCYKGLLEKAYALQHSIDVYFSLLQNTIFPALTGLENLPGNMNFNIQNDGSLEQSSIFFTRQNSDQASDSRFLPKADCFVSQHLDGLNKTKDVCLKTNLLLDSLRESEERMFTSETNVPIPVDLTKGATPVQIQQLNEVNEESKNADNLGKAIRDAVGNFLNSTNHNGIQVGRKQISHVQKPVQYAEPNSPPMNDRLGIQQAKSIDLSFVSPVHDSLDRSYFSYNTHTVTSQKRKTYFKNKRLRKTYAVHSPTTSNAGLSDSSPNKKSNFRGTSEEENEVSPDFKPTESNGQIILSDAHPNVKLSKDIFYSLIVKSSGSATRLIRLLMKSFFTQDELAASSLSGEGIYKQRLEPSITEAIKIFIRKRHPQLKTGSINLCMTDVCVQARRVANNQRSRQHPSRLNSFPNEAHAVYSAEAASAEPSSSSTVGLMGLKSRVSGAMRSADVNSVNKEPISLVHESKLSHKLASPCPDSWVQSNRSLDERLGTFSNVPQEERLFDLGAPALNNSASTESNDVCLSLRQSPGSRAAHSPQTHPHIL
ncbi:hypothetical protein CSKR_200834 [Clonorchis sinensis]|uniref:BEN domain-containing protein n=1 Tax=Clonorchis sinensis TaxID=79923 RepID=A0A8T1MHF7_CLOSI|nr:hypothetical protein CSKR_200834 [Clonorchis sinensis]